MPDWLGKDGKMTSHNIVKLSSSERPWDIVIGFLFQYGVIQDTLLPTVFI